MLIVEHPFELSRGYIDREGTLHREGVMRLATAADEIYPMRDPRVQGLPAYLIIILLSRVVVRLGTLGQVDPVTACPPERRPPVLESPASGPLIIPEEKL